MKTLALAALALVLAAPVVTAPTVSDAQVMTGRGSARMARAPRPALSAREEDQLFAAQDAVYDLEQRIAEIEAAQAPTTEQTTQLPDLRTQLEEQQATVDRLEAKRDRRRS